MQIYKEKKCKSVKDYLKYYTLCDVKPFTEALIKQKDMFLNTLGVDILKDCYGVPSIAHRYMMQTKSEKLYTPTKKAFELLKKGMTGCCCQVFTKYHKVDKTKIKSHKIEKPKTCKKILGYDANFLYLFFLNRSAH